MKEDKKYWIDQNGNKWSKSAFTRETAEIFSRTLIKCKDCTDCKDCTNCSFCTVCKNCIDCRQCKDCKDCAYCINCQNCQNCKDCASCINCQNCINCAYCINCTYCISGKDCVDHITIVRGEPVSFCNWCGYAVCQCGEFMPFWSTKHKRKKL